METVGDARRDVHDRSRLHGTLVAVHLEYRAAFLDDVNLVLAMRLTGLPPTGGNQVEPLTENAAAFAAIEEALRGARESIWAEYYIIQRDGTGLRFAVEVEQVPVRSLLGGISARTAVGFWVAPEDVAACAATLEGAGHVKGLVGP